MPIQLHETTSTRKLIDVTVDGWPQGVHLYGTVEWYAGGRADRYEIEVNVPCVYSDDARYRVALCTTPPRLVLIEDEPNIMVEDELCYLAQWTFTKATDTCANVTIDVPRRALVPEPPTLRDEPVFELHPKQIECVACGGMGEVKPDPESEAVEPCVLCNGTGRTLLFDANGEPVMRPVQVGTETIEIPPEPLPTPTMHLVASCDLPASTPERTEGRKLRRRVRELRVQVAALRDAGTTYGAMTAAQRAIVGELVALTGEPVRLALP